jgi:putative oxidoreductase
MALGFLTPVGSALIIGAMAQAIRTVHGPKGPWAAEGGWEYNAVIMAVAFAVADVGPGEWSVDNALGTELSGPLCAIAALGAGLAGPAVLVRPAGDAPAEAASTAPAAEGSSA